MFVSKIIPSIHNLPQVIYIRWMDIDWYIKKISSNLEISLEFRYFVGAKFELFGEVFNKAGIGQFFKNHVIKIE